MEGTLRSLYDDQPRTVEGSPGLWGLYKAKVTNNNDDKHRGRIKVMAPAVVDGQELPAWAEPASANLFTPGKGYGGLWLPQKDDWVWVEFEGGDSNEPRWHPGWWGDDELPDELKQNYPNRRGFKTKSGHIFIYDDADDGAQDGGAIIVGHRDGHFYRIDKDGVSITAVNGKKIVEDAAEIDLIKNASQRVIFGDKLLADLASKLNTIISVLQAGTQGGPTAQQLTALPGVLADLETFITQLTDGETYVSQKVKVG